MGVLSQFKQQQDRYASIQNAGREMNDLNFIEIINHCMDKGTSSIMPEL